MPVRTKITHEQRTYINARAAGLNQKRAAMAAGIHPRTARAWQQLIYFREAYDAAMMNAAPPTDISADDTADDDAINRHTPREVLHALLDSDREDIRLRAATALVNRDQADAAGAFTGGSATVTIEFPYDEIRYDLPAGTIGQLLVLHLPADAPKTTETPEGVSADPDAADA